MLEERSTQLPETVDEDGDPCEDLSLLVHWIKSSLAEILERRDFDVKALNFSTYGASFVHVDANGAPVAPLYNYLKPLSDSLTAAMYDRYGGKQDFARTTASPTLGNLNSGLQLLMIKSKKPAIFQRIETSLHLPQFASSLITNARYSDLTSIGCHTSLWHFGVGDYHPWVSNEGLIGKLAPIRPSSEVLKARAGEHILYSGIGLHDSSAALIPYLSQLDGEFALLSTGTWSITLNPFNKEPLTDHELEQDCLCYLAYSGKQVKASRLFSGHFHEVQTQRLAEHFNKSQDHFKTAAAQPSLGRSHGKMRDLTKAFEPFDPAGFESYEDAYEYLLEELVARQVKATRLVLGGVKKLFVDGGFSTNTLFMALLSKALPGVKVFAADVAQASALGAALCIHDSWNNTPPAGILKIKEIVTAG